MSFMNPASIYGQNVAFSQDMMEGTFIPTIKINPTGWDTSNQPVVLAATVAHTLANCTPDATETPDLTAVGDRAHLSLTLLAPLQFI